MRRSRAGVTLIELTLVTFLLLTLIGLSIPIFKKTFSDLSARDASYNISKLMNYAQGLAVLERNNFKIAFDFQAGKYRLFLLNSLKKPPVYEKVRGRFGRQFSLPQGLKMSGNRKDMVFYPDGHCDETKINVLTKDAGYSIIAKRFGNMIEVKKIEIE